jgi:spatacsin
VKSRLPVTAFKQAVADDVSADDMHALSASLLREAFQSAGIRLAVLSFIELSDIKFGRDSATDSRSASRSTIDSPPTQHLT